MPSALRGRLQVVAALLHALNSPCSASTIEKELSASHAPTMRLFSWISASKGRPPSSLSSPRAHDSRCVPIQSRIAFRGFADPIAPCSSRLGSLRHFSRLCEPAREAEVRQGQSALLSGMSPLEANSDSSSPGPSSTSAWTVNRRTGGGEAKPAILPRMVGGFQVRINEFSSDHRTPRHGLYGTGPTAAAVGLRLREGSRLVHGLPYRREKEDGRILIDIRGTVISSVARVASGRGGEPGPD